jgi:hypothetical protein
MPFAEQIARPAFGSLFNRALGAQGRIQYFAEKRPIQNFSIFVSDLYSWLSISNCQNR